MDEPMEYQFLITVERDNADGVLEHMQYPINLSGHSCEDAFLQLTRDWLHSANNIASIKWEGWRLVGAVPVEENNGNQ